MSEPEEKFRYFVEPSCICCAACWRAVPEHFASHDLDAFAIVTKQPETERELARCEEARLLCPVQAIRREKRGSA